MTSTPEHERQQTTEARDKIAVAAGAALLAAGLILVMFVLPAEYGIDPVGTGARFGLLELGVTGRQVEALAAASAAGRSLSGRHMPRTRSRFEGFAQFASMSSASSRIVSGASARPA